nr:hypothetical protein [Tanacetum cinerariifolium]
ERLWDELYRRKTSMEDVEGVCGAAAFMVRWVRVLDMQVTLHDKRIVMQVTLHYEAIVMQVTLHDKRKVMQVALHYEFKQKIPHEKWKLGFTDVKSASTPIETKKPLLKDLDGKDVDVHVYRSMIGLLMYLTSSRPDIMFVVYGCARF